ncbi:cytosolic protein [Vibrio metschnikovii]|nr:cytosolic protein [Vibrio metschnikovii]
MKLLYWLNEALSLSHPALQARLPFTGSNLIDDVFVRYQLVDIDQPLLFLFSPSGSDVRQQELHADYVPWGYDFAQQQQVNVIAFQHLGMTNWFRSPSLIEFLEQLAPLLVRFPLRLGYGLSRGGFAIGAFANLLQLNHVLLFYPVSTKNKQRVPWDTRVSTEAAQKFDWQGKYHDKDLGAAQGYIIYDPNDPIDALHAQRYPELIQVPISGMGHGIRSNDTDKLSFYNHIAEQFIHQQKIAVDDCYQEARQWFFERKEPE